MSEHESTSKCKIPPSKQEWHDLRVYDFLYFLSRGQRMGHRGLPDNSGIRPTSPLPTLQSPPLCLLNVGKSPVMQNYAAKKQHVCLWTLNADWHVPERRHTRFRPMQVITMQGAFNVLNHVLNISDTRLQTLRKLGDRCFPGFSKHGDPNTDTRMFVLLPRRR